MPVLTRTAPGMGLSVYMRVAAFIDVLVDVARLRRFDMNQGADEQACNDGKDSYLSHGLPPVRGLSQGRRYENP